MSGRARPRRWGRRVVGAWRSRRTSDTRTSPSGPVLPLLKRSPHGSQRLCGPLGPINRLSRLTHVAPIAPPVLRRRAGRAVRIARSARLTERGWSPSDPCTALSSPGRRTSHRTSRPSAGRSRHFSNASCILPRSILGPHGPRPFPLVGVWHQLHRHGGSDDGSGG